jgi:hypothetical protein
LGGACKLFPPREDGTVNKAEKELVNGLLSDMAGIEQITNWHLTLEHEMRGKMERLSMGVKEKPAKTTTARVGGRKSPARAARRKTAKGKKRRTK